MNRKKYIKGFADLKFFELPENSLKSKLTFLKYTVTASKISTERVDVFLCNKTSNLDKLLISEYFDFSFVILKDEVVKQISEGTISKTDLAELLNSINTLKTAFISVVIFPEVQKSIFGRVSQLSNNITDFIKKIGLSVRIVTLVGTYFSNPIWSNRKMPCNLKLEQRFSISKNEIATLSDKEFFNKLNNLMPSSASVYASKYPLFVRDNKRAEGLEKIFYVCPNCRKFLSLYSEFNCVKCRECGTAIEISNNFEINLSKRVRDFDEFEDFQFNLLASCTFTKNALKTYEDTFICTVLDNIIVPVTKSKLKIFENKIDFVEKEKNVSLGFKNILSIELRDENIILIVTKNQEKIAFLGKNNENFVILIDIFRIFNLKTK